MQAWIGLGGNREDSAQLLEAAVELIDDLPATSVRQRSSLYRSAPWGEENQPDFVNAVLQLETALEPGLLLRSLLGIETALGRVRTDARWGPRCIDIDLLSYEDLRMQSDELTLPHPYMHERAFVLLPLLELAPEFHIPGLGPAVEQLAKLSAAERKSVAAVQPEQRKQ